MARVGAQDLYRDAEPLISVLMPTYNRAELLRERSVASVLRQTYSRFEIVIVGDACTDHTESLLRDALRKCVLDEIDSQEKLVARIEASIIGEAPPREEG